MGFNPTDEVLAVSGSSKKLEIFHVSDIPLGEEGGGWKKGFPMGGGGRTWGSVMLDCGGVVVGMGWNRGQETQLCTSDLAGKILLWDVEARSSLVEFSGHQVIWCFCFCCVGSMFFFFQTAFSPLSLPNREPAGPSIFLPEHTIFLPLLLMIEQSNYGI